MRYRNAANHHDEYNIYGQYVIIVEDLKGWDNDLGARSWVGKSIVFVIVCYCLLLFVIVC